ncbi:hypothetical protein CPB84DRAFT_1745740 [Gymnopilus junonius]|uniref:Uncharacterized protein n=1 Tax=Gymnopilus junonius TaxID=109634 RepID=A0A9P5NPR4_GYMJU|nr:hypothetical protein CPB84DRAFT_1745740 [Gymnopilus junonius]
MNSGVPPLHDSLLCQGISSQLQIEKISTGICGIAYCVVLFLYIISFRALERKYGPKSTPPTPTSSSSQKKRWFYILYISFMLMLSTAALIEDIVTTAQTASIVNEPDCNSALLFQPPFTVFPLTIWAADAFMYCIKEYARTSINCTWHPRALFSSPNSNPTNQEASKNSSGKLWKGAWQESCALIALGEVVQLVLAFMTQAGSPLPLQVTFFLLPQICVCIIQVISPLLIIYRVAKGIDSETRNTSLNQNTTTDGDAVVQAVRRQVKKFQQQSLSLFIIRVGMRSIVDNIIQSSEPITNL